MPYHTVRQGEHLSRIAEDYGFSDFSTIWDDPKNAALKQTRRNPNVLYPGDQLFIPTSQLRQELAATDKRHLFHLSRRRLKLRLRLLDVDGQPLAQTEYNLHVDGTVHHLTTDGDGRINCDIQAAAHDALLVFKDPTTFVDIGTRLRIGDLDPVDQVSGQIARLSNLGYFFYRGDGHDEERLHRGIQEFQCDHGLEVTGRCGPETQCKLTELHGC